MGSTRLMLIPSLMGLWLTWIGSRFNHRGKLEKVNPEYIFAWFFAMTSILVTQFIQEKLEVVLRLAGDIMLGGNYINVLPGDKCSKIMEIVGRQGSFQITIYIFIAVMSIFDFCCLYRGFKWVSCFWYEDSAEYKRFSECYRCFEDSVALNVIPQEPARFMLVRMRSQFRLFIEIGFLYVKSVQNRSVRVHC